MTNLNIENALSEQESTTQQSYTNTNANGNDNLQSFKRLKIDKTPFEIVFIPEKGYYLNWGVFRMSEAYYTKDEVIEYLEEYKWQITAAMAGIIATQVIQDTNLQKEAEERMQNNG